MNEEQKEKWYNSFTKEQLIERCEYLQRSCERKENSIIELEKEIERLNNIIEKIDEFISYKIIIEANAKGYQITLKDLTDIKKKLLELKGVGK